MLTPDQISELHRLHWVEKWPLRKIARHLHIGRRTIAKYLETPAARPARRERAHKIEPWKAAIAELLEKDPDANAPVIAQHLTRLGFEGGLTIIKDYLRAVRKNSASTRAASVPCPFARSGTNRSTPSERVGPGSTELTVTPQVPRISGGTASMSYPR